MNDDLISRQAAIEACLNGWNYDMETIEHIQDNIRRLPSVQQKQNLAYWVGKELGKCSNCGHNGCASDIWNGCLQMFCPNCGAKMEDGRNMSEEETIIDHLERILFFNQRAGRELWFDKPKEVQDRDIENNERDLQETINYIRTNQRKHGKWEHDRCTECGKSLEDLFSGEFYYDDEEVKFCPNCGAKMEGDGE